MIDEAIGKILGMAMAYGASAMGMFVAYANYRKRIVKADKIMTPAAWAVAMVSLLAVVGGVVVVAQLAAAPATDEPAREETGAPLEPVTEAEPPSEPAPAEAEVSRERSRWPLIGMLVPALIFLLATAITAGLHRHFSTQGG